MKQNGCNLTISLHPLHLRHIYVFSWPLAAADRNIVFGHSITECYVLSQAGSHPVYTVLVDGAPVGKGHLGTVAIGSVAGAIKHGAISVYSISVSIGDPILGGWHEGAQEWHCGLIFAIHGVSGWVSISLHFTVFRLLLAGRLCCTVCVAIQTLAGRTGGGLEPIVDIGGGVGRISTIDSVSSILEGLWQEAIGGSVGLLSPREESQLRVVGEHPPIQAMARHAATDGAVGLCCRLACKGTRVSDNPSWHSNLKLSLLPYCNVS